MKTLRLDLLLIGLFLPLSLDFKGVQAGGSSLQFALVLVTLFAAGALFAQTPLRRDPPLLPMLGAIAGTLLVVSGLLAVLRADVEAGLFARVAAPFVLFVVGYLAALRVHADNRVEQALAVVWIGLVVSVVFTLVYAAIVWSPTAHELRHQLLSPVLGVAFVVAVSAVFVQGRDAPWTAYIVIAICIVAVVASVTRSAAITLLVTSTAALLLAPVGLPSRTRLVASLLIWAVVLVGAAAAVDAALDLEWFERWYHRLVDGPASLGFDVTSITRVAEAQDQIDRWLESTRSIFLGAGLGGDYGLAAEHFELLSRALDRGAIYSHFAATVGHNFWVYSLFAGGLLLGIWFPIFIVYVLCRIAVAAWRNRRSTDVRWLQGGGSLPCLVLLTFVVSTIGGNPMGSRYASLIYGFFLGLAVAQLGTQPSRWLAPSSVRFDAAKSGS